MKVERSRVFGITGVTRSRPSIPKFISQADAIGCDGIALRLVNYLVSLAEISPPSDSEESDKR